MISNYMTKTTETHSQEKDKESWQSSYQYNFATNKRGELVGRVGWEHLWFLKVVEDTPAAVRGVE